MHKATRGILGAALAAGMVGAALAPGAAHAASPRTAPSLITWTPANGGAVTLTQGQTDTETASFVSSVALTNVKAVVGLSNWARSHGIHGSVVSLSPASTSIPANTPVLVTFNITAGTHAKLSSFHADVHLWGNANGRPQARLWHTLDLRVSVIKEPLHLSWTPAQRGALRVQPGQTVTQTVTFVSNIAVTNAQVTGRLSDFALDHGTTVNVTAISPALASSAIAANTPYTVTYTVSVVPTARVQRSYHAELDVMGSINGGLVVKLWHDMDFWVTVAPR